MSHPHINPTRQTSVLLLFSENQEDLGSRGLFPSGRAGITANSVPSLLFWSLHSSSMPATGREKWQIGLQGDQRKETGLPRVQLIWEEGWSSGECYPSELPWLLGGRALCEICILTVRALSAGGCLWGFRQTKRVFMPFVHFPTNNQRVRDTMIFNN